MKIIRIGIIGTGLISKRHMRVWSQIPGVEIAAACDIHEQRLAEWGEQYGIDPKNLYRDYRDLLARNDIDAVDVCLHNNLHAPMSIAVMKAGKHCYCEKPMAGSYADAKLMYEASRKLNRKLAVQLSSIFNLQTRLAREYTQNGELGRLYHMRSVGQRRLGRPGVDFRGEFKPEFFSTEFAGHGALFDMGVYHISQLLFIAGIPELECVFGHTYQEMEVDPRLLGERKFEVEELGVGFARYKGGLTLDIIESWALNIDDASLGNSFVSGSKAGLRIENTDGYGGPLAVDPGSFDPPKLTLYKFENGMRTDTDLNIPANAAYELELNPALRLYNDNQMHWLAYLNDELTDETRYNTPWLALQTMLVSEGVFLSQKLGRSVTADEIDALSASTAVRHQKTDWGTLDYEF